MFQKIISSEPGLAGWLADVLLYVFRIANKQDKKETLNKAEVIEELRLEGLVNKYECPCHIVSSCLPFQNLNIDGEDGCFQSSLDWFLVLFCPSTRSHTLPFRATSKLPTK